MTDECISFLEVGGFIGSDVIDEQMNSKHGKYIQKHATFKCMDTL